jgi:hypothetical protein
MLTSRKETKKKRKRKRRSANTGKRNTKKKYKMKSVSKRSDANQKSITGSPKKTLSILWIPRQRKKSTRRKANDEDTAAC